MSDSVAAGVVDDSSSSSELCRRARTLAPWFVLLYAGLIGGWCIAAAHPLYHGLEWITYEYGNQLYRAQVLLSGGQLYRDVVLQYGPLAAYLHAGYCGLAGVGITQSLVWHLGWSLVTIALGYQVTRRSLPPLPAAVVTALVWVPLLLEPGGLVHVFNAEHYTFERIFLLLVTLLWRPPTEQALGRTLAMGLLLGAWQCTKFGGAVYATAALAGVDLIWLRGSGVPAGTWRRWLGRWGALLGAVAACELLLAIWCLSWGSIQETWEVCWPVWVVQGYPDHNLSRFPAWHGLIYFVQFQMLPLGCLLVGVAGVWLGPPSQRLAADTSAWIAPAFYLLATGTFLGVELHYLHYGWALAPLAGWGWARLSPAVRRALVVVFLLPTLLLFRIVLFPPEAMPYVLPGGESLHLGKEGHTQMQQLAEVARRTHDRDARPVVLAWLGDYDGGGYLHYFEPDYPLRNYWSSRVAFRPQDADQLRASLDRVGAVIIRAPSGTESAARRSLSRFLPPDLVEDLLLRVRHDPELSSSRYAVMLRRDGP